MEIESQRERISNLNKYVEQTDIETMLVFSSTLTATATESGETPVLLKLDNLKPSGSFKIRVLATWRSKL